MYQSAQDKQRIDRLKNFGIASEVEVELAGINGKMSELNAAIGLLQLRHVDAAIAVNAMLGLVEGVETGQADIYVEARGEGGRTHRFWSDRNFDSTFVHEYGSDLQLGTEFVVDALREYSDLRAAG